MAEHVDFLVFLGRPGMGPSGEKTYSGSNHAQTFMEC